MRITKKYFVSVVVVACFHQDGVKLRSYPDYPELFKRLRTALMTGPASKMGPGVAVSDVKCVIPVANSRVHNCYR